MVIPQHNHRLPEVRGVLAAAVGCESMDDVQRLGHHPPLFVRHLRPQLFDLFGSERTDRKDETTRQTPGKHTSISSAQPSKNSHVISATATTGSP